MTEVVATTGAVCRAKLHSQIIITSKPTPNFFQAGCPSCRPTNSVKALKGNDVGHIESVKLSSSQALPLLY